ncbi:MAG: hypothetical protein PQJ60_10840 [Spirochaetales bacterium]|nr:hypothetical protein [Spirochaetales bacterium]
MAYNLPDGCHDDDKEAPWNQEEEESKVCEICGGSVYYNRYFKQDECSACGIFDPEEVPICTMCGDHRPRVKKTDKGFRAECDCGVCGQFEDNAQAAITSWKILHGN